MEPIVYLDNSSTTKPCRRAVEYMNRALCDEWGNPSSLHRLGMEAEITVSEARESVAKMLHSRTDEVYFTGSGTEANNTAIFGAAQHGAKRGKRIVTTAIEHPSVLEPMKRLSEQGFDVVYLHPDRSGVIAPEKLAAAITPDTVLVSMMLVNNEIGSIQPVREAAACIRAVGAPALLHCDAVQAFGKLPLSVSSLGVDLLSASGHKIHGPKGIGFLYIRQGVHIPAYLVGGGQERGVRSGTEPVPLICGLRGAIEELPDPKTQLIRETELWRYAVKALLSTGIITVHSDENCLPYILNISVPGYRSETLLHFLESRSIYVSSGSACAKGKGSYVLQECGLSAQQTDSALRLSFSRFTTEEEIDRLAAALTEAAGRLRKA